MITRLMYQSRVTGHEMALLLELSLLGKRLWQGQINTKAMCTTRAYQLLYLLTCFCTSTTYMGENS